MRFTGQLVQLKLDQVLFANQLKSHLRDLIEEGARVWLTAVLGRVPLWSGMARGSLLELSRLVNGTIILTPLRAKSRIPQGEVLGTATPNYDNTKVEIEIETNVPHYNLQEYTKPAKGGSPTAPWHSVEAGKIAFNEFSRTVTLPMPQIIPKIIRL